MEKYFEMFLTCALNSCKCELHIYHRAVSDIIGHMLTFELQLNKIRKNICNNQLPISKLVIDHQDKLKHQGQIQQINFL